MTTCVMFFSSAFFMSQMMHLISLCIQREALCCVIVCKLIVYFNKMTSFFFFFFGRSVLLLLLAYLIDFSNSFFIWMVYGSIALKMIFMFLLAISSDLSHQYFNTTFLSLKPLFMLGCP